LPKRHSSQAAIDREEKCGEESEKSVFPSIEMDCCLDFSLFTLHFSLFIATFAAFLNKMSRISAQSGMVKSHFWLFVSRFVAFLSRAGV
jgi:hypothetical protein